MNITYFYLALVIGLCLSLLSEGLLGVSTGGMVVAAYLSMIWDDIPQICLIFAIAVATYTIVNYVLPKYLIIFGKRKFVATILVAVIFKLVLELCFPILPFAVVSFRGVGIITPALIANTANRQGFRYTIPAVLISGFLTFAAVGLFAWLI